MKNPNPPIIAAQGLSVGYKKVKNVLTNVNFQIFARDFVFITGASGSGKSTLLKAFYGDSEEMTGELFVNGTPMHAAKKRQIQDLRAKMGIVFQDYKLIEEWNVEKNIFLPMQINGFAREFYTKETKNLLNHVKLLQKAHAYPLELSGGEQQRVAMARAIAHRPPILLADEPTGNLDDYSSDIIWGLLKSANEQLKITIIVVTHRAPRSLKIRHRKFNIQDREIYEYH